MQRIGDQIDAAFIFAWADFVNVLTITRHCVASRLKLGGKICLVSRASALVQFEIVIAAANTDAATGVFGGLLMLIIGLFIILLGIAWIIFPFIVLNSLGKIEKLLAKQNQTLAQIADRQNEANRALQFLVDKK